MDKILAKRTIIDGLVRDIEYPVLSQVEFESLVSHINSIWGLKSISREKIRDFLLNEKLFQENHLRLNNGLPSKIYHQPAAEIDIFDIASTRSRDAYFSFYSALFINGLTLQIPKQIYITLERRTFKEYHNSLSQENIDRTFARPPRITSDTRAYKGMNVNFINGQHQDNIGIVAFRDKYTVSDLERTLIDVSIRPFYSGGVTQVLEAFMNAKERINISKLFEYYSRLKYTYPYHRVIGFYLEKAGYAEADYNRFLFYGDMDFEFYLSYNILHRQYSDKWKLYYPKGL